jgi:hypothetical protein
MPCHAMPCHAILRFAHKQARFDSFTPRGALPSISDRLSPRAAVTFPAFPRRQLPDAAAPPVLPPPDFARTALPIAAAPGR